MGDLLTAPNIAECNLGTHEQFGCFAYDRCVGVHHGSQPWILPTAGATSRPTHAVESSRVAFRRLAQNHRLLQVRSRVLPLHRAALCALRRRLLAHHPRACRNRPAGRYDLPAAPPRRSEDPGNVQTRSQDASWTRRLSFATSTFCECSVRGNFTVIRSEETSFRAGAPSCIRTRSDWSRRVPAK